MDQPLWPTSKAEILLFMAMVGLAAANRYRLTPTLGRALDARATQGAALAALGGSLVAEAELDLLALSLVAWFGILPPPSAH